MVVLEKIAREVSKKELKKIGDRIRKNEATPEDFAIISEFRSSHAPLIRTLRDTLKNFKKGKVLKTSSFIISRRIKRMPSIIKKLERFEDMNLSRMQDLGGVRIILDDIADVKRLGNHLAMVTYKQKDKNNFLVKNIKDYIQKPKVDGYRSIHHVYEYQGNSYPELKGLLIELQIRTLKQHQWATAVEILDTVQNSSLKTGEGEVQYKDFFKLCSYAIAYIENGNKEPEGYTKGDKIENIIKNILDLDEVYKIFDKLLSITIVNNLINNSFKASDYLILRLDLKKRRVSYEQIVNKETAEFIYLMEENKNLGNPDFDVVMVSADDLKSLKKSYPNYFLDARGFINTIKNLAKKFNK